MIVKSHEADRYTAKPPKELAIALVYGPDAGLVQERAEKLLKSVVPDLTDPLMFRTSANPCCWTIPRGWPMRPPPSP
jgi:DNA polymerase III delta subunit